MATNPEMGRGFIFFVKIEIDVWSWLLFQQGRQGFYISMKVAVLYLCEGARTVEAASQAYKPWDLSVSILRSSVFS